MGESGATYINFRGETLSMAGFTSPESRIWAIGALPLRAELFCLCHRGVAGSRRVGGKLAGVEANRPVPAVGFVRA